MRGLDNLYLGRTKDSNDLIAEKNNQTENVIVISMHKPGRVLFTIFPFFLFPFQKL